MSIHVLVTGGAGYLGSVLVHELLLRGFSVTVLDNFMHRQQSLAHLCAFPKLEVVRGDAREIVSHPALLKKADVLIPLAAIVGAPACDLDRMATLSTNLNAVHDLVQQASTEQVIVYPNTNSGYGRGDGMCTEDSPLLPISHYGRTKVDAERRVLGHRLGVSLRFATLFGCSPRMRLDLMVNDFVYRAVRDMHISIFEGHFRRNFLHVRDAAGAFIHVIKHAAGMAGQAFNAGRTDANMTKAELAERILKRVGGGFGTLHHVEGRADPDQRDYVVSNARLERSGWLPRYTIDEGIDELVRCYQQPFENHRNV
jgi:nucleoside-diphosphate-sugar epimerase